MNLKHSDPGIKFQGNFRQVSDKFPEIEGTFPEISQEGGAISANVLTAGLKTKVASSATKEINVKKKSVSFSQTRFERFRRFRRFARFSRFLRFRTIKALFRIFYVDEEIKRFRGKNR